MIKNEGDETSCGQSRSLCMNWYNGTEYLLKWEMNE